MILPLSAALVVQLEILNLSHQLDHVLGLGAIGNRGEAELVVVVLERGGEGFGNAGVTCLDRCRLAVGLVLGCDIAPRSFHCLAVGLGLVTTGLTRLSSLRLRITPHRVKPLGRDGIALLAKDLDHLVLVRRPFKGNLLDPPQHRRLGVDEDGLGDLRLAGAVDGAAVRGEAAGARVTAGAGDGGVEGCVVDDVRAGALGRVSILSSAREARCRGTYLLHELLEAFTPQRRGAVASAQNSQAIQLRPNPGPNRVVVQVRLDIIGCASQGDNIHPRLLPHQPRHNNALKHLPHMLPHTPLPRHLINPRVMIPSIMHSARHRQHVPLNRSQPLPALGPPPQLAGIGEHHARRAGVDGRALLGAERVDEAENGAVLDAAAAADDAVREHAEGLAGLAEEEDDAGLGGEGGGGKDGDVRVRGGRAEGERDFGQAGGFEAGVDDFGYGIWGRLG